MPPSAWANSVAQIVISENSPSNAGVVRRMARSDHWRWVSTPRWARTSWNVVSTRQRETNHCRIVSGAASRSVLRNACGVFAERILDQHPADRHWRDAAVIPDRGAGRGSQRALLIAIPLRHDHRGPGRLRVVQDGPELRQGPSLQRGSAALAGSARAGRLEQVGIEPQPGDHAIAVRPKELARSPSATASAGRWS